MVRPFRTAAADMAEDKKSDGPSIIIEDKPHQNMNSLEEQNGNKEKENKTQSACPVLKHFRKKSCARICAGIWHIVLGLVTIIFCLAEIIVTIVASVANKLYDAEQSGHMVAMVVLAVTGAITLSIIIFSMVGVCRKHTKPLYTTAFVLAVIALIQALLTGLVVNVNDADENFIITKSLAESFKLAQEGNKKHLDLWSSTQSDLKCCGLYGADDYRGPQSANYFPPNVPISCCPSYNPKKPDLAQERERELCKAQRNYYDVGCKQPVLEVFRHSSLAVVVVTSLLIVFELLLAISAAVLSKKKKRDVSESKS